MIADILNATPGWSDMRDAAGLDDTDITQILDEAAKLASDLLKPLAANADSQHCRVEQGRVVTPDGYPAAYATMGENGWITADLDPDLGGMGIPLPLQIAASLPFEGAALPFMMALGSTRAGAHLLATCAPDLAAEWGPHLADGSWAATICISEPDAGSDVGRIRTAARETETGWTVSGTKCWISFGDHDMTRRIGHMTLARTGPAELGTRGLSLFLIPSTVDDAPNGVHVERIEEKLGLHGSPTCVLRFENAKAQMIGDPGRGLNQLFHMIELMRLQVAGQGAGLAMECAALAHAYATDRKQGGAPDAPPLPIARHADVQRMLTGIDAQAMLATALVFEAGVAVEQGKTDPAAAAYAAFLLPLAKTMNGEAAQEVASTTIQVLGGAGYTREWPAERYYRDARITTIYEGTTGMQGQDFLLRRLVRDQGAGLAVLADRIKAAPEGVAAPLLETFQAVSDDLLVQPAPVLLRAADAYLRAGWIVTGAYLADRLAARPAFATAARFWLATAPARLDLHLAEITRALSDDPT